jgi:hypothetical protein
MGTIDARGVFLPIPPILPIRPFLSVPPILPILP